MAAFRRRFRPASILLLMTQSQGKTSFQSKMRFLLVVLCAAVCTTGAPNRGSAASARVAFSHSLPALDGNHLKATVVEVTYQPGGASSPHHHPCAVIGYVIEGAVRMRVNDQPEAVYKVGESFYEAPNDAHRVSANAS